MNLFQILALLVVGCFFVISVVSIARGWTTRKESIVWGVVWLAAGVAIAKPNVTGAVAKAMGIGRGADLVLYCSVVVMLVGFLMIYARLRRIRREMTLLVRQLAIRDAVSTAPGSDTAGDTAAGAVVQDPQ